MTSIASIVAAEQPTDSPLPPAPSRKGSRGRERARPLAATKNASSA